MVPWPEIPMELDWNVSYDAIETSMGKLGYFRRVQRQKPPNEPRTRALELGFASDHENLTVEDWGKWIWTDETWVIGGTHGKRWVTVRPGEELSRAAVGRRERRRGWMFWASFRGGFKGPCLVWDPAWGKINSALYIQHIVPRTTEFCSNYHRKAQQQGNISNCLASILSGSQPY
jgi:hypothetical protein